MSGTLRDKRKIYTSSGGGDTTAIENRLTVLENVTNKITYFESVSLSSGAVTLPSGATVLLNEFYAGEDAYVSTITGGQPTGILPE